MQLAFKDQGQAVIYLNQSYGGLVPVIGVRRQVEKGSLNSILLVKIPGASQTQIKLAHLVINLILSINNVYAFGTLAVKLLCFSEVILKTTVSVIILEKSCLLVTWFKIVPTLSVSFLSLSCKERRKIQYFSFLKMCIPHQPNKF